MNAPYCCYQNQAAFTDYYVKQVGGAMNYYQGGVQQGHGLGGIFKSLGRTVVPFLSRGVKSLGKRLVKTGAHVAKDMLQGGNFKESIVNRGKQAGAEMLDDFLSTQPPKPYKKKRGRSTAPSRRKAKRRKTNDIFS